MLLLLLLPLSILNQILALKGEKEAVNAERESRRRSGGWWANERSRMSKLFQTPLRVRVFATWGTFDRCRRHV
jgi:hypothetical protein